MRASDGDADQARERMLPALVETAGRISADFADRGRRLAISRPGRR
jgi:hypothetical protein